MDLNFLLLDSLSASIPKLLEIQFCFISSFSFFKKKFLDYLLYTTCYALCITDKQDLLWPLPFGTPNIEELLAVHFMGPQCRKVEGEESGEDE